MVKLRTALLNKVNNLCSAHGVNLNKESLASEKGLKAVLEMHFDLLVNLELKITIDQIRSLNKSIAELEETIEGQSWKGIRISPASRGSAGSTAVSCFRSSAISATLRTRASWRPTLASFRVSNSKCNRTQRPDHQTRDQARANVADSVCPARATLQPVSENLLRKNEKTAGPGEGDRRPGAQVLGNHL